MPHWLLKSALHRLFATLPHPHWWNEQLQKHVTKSLSLDADQLRARLDHCHAFLEPFFRMRGSDATGFRVLELGTGWYPTLPLALYLCGASEVWTYDIRPLLRSRRLEHLLRLFGDLADRGDLQQRLPWVRPERLTALLASAPSCAQLTPAAFLEKFRVHALVGDASQTDLPAGSIDFFCSFSVLEYLPREVLLRLHAEFVRLASPRALAVHYFQFEDEYASFDRSLNRLNFLRFSDAQWRWLNSALNPLSRLRVSDHRALFQQAGWQVVEETNTRCDPAMLDALPLAPEFRRYARADVEVLQSWMVVRPASLPPQSDAR